MYRSAGRDPDVVSELFYNDCNSEDHAWAFERLTPFPVRPLTEPLHVPRLWTAPIPRNFILCKEDHSHPLEMGNYLMRALGVTNLLGMRSSHSPFLSRPAETAKSLDICAKKSV